MPAAAALKGHDSFKNLKPQHAASCGALHCFSHEAAETHARMKDYVMCPQLGPSFTFRGSRHSEQTGN
jgi:hypothetical protein